MARRSFMTARDNDRQRARPAFIDQFINHRIIDRGIIRDQTFLGDQDRELLVSRPFFHFPQTRHGLFVIKIDRDPIHCFRRKNDKPAVANDLGALRDLLKFGELRINVNNFGFH